jgi:hypothetical protein
MASFDIVLQTAGTLHPDGEPENFISTHTGVIRCTRNDKVSRVGRLQAYRIHAGLAREAGESIFDVCDAHSQDLHEVYAALFDPAEGDLKESVRNRFDVFDTDVLVLDYILLSPKWRGLKIGLLATRKLIDLLGGGCGLVVSWTHPLNPDAEEFSDVTEGWIPRQAGKEDEREARRKLRRHFGRMGFKRIDKTRFDGLSLSQLTPSLSDLIRPSK